MWTALRAGFGALAAVELWTTFVTRRDDRRRLFRRAIEEARRQQKPLMVVGDPDTGFVTRFFGRDYGCGDVCTDITGCPKCPAALRGRLEDVLPRIPSRSHIVFVSCTLEYVDDLPRCARELDRVATPGGLFVVRVAPTNPAHSMFWLYPGAKWLVDSAPPSGPWRFRRFPTPR